MPASIELIGVDYPGRGSRKTDAPCDHLETLAEALVTELLSDDDAGAFALLGHSMGGLVAFEAAVHLARQNTPPVHLFICACRPPGLSIHSFMHLLPDDQFLTEFNRRLRRQRVGAAKNELPVLRSDVTAAERYWAPPERTVTCPLSVIGGIGDELHSRSTLAQWCLRTTGRFSLQFVPGGHFFRGHLDQVAQVLSTELDRSRAEQFLEDQAYADN